jgi:hypothetical protein
VDIAGHAAVIEARWEQCFVKLSLVDESESVNGDGDCGGETGLAGLGFRGCVFGSVTSLVVIPESCSRLLVLQVRSSVRVEGCRDRVCLSNVEKLLVSKKK